MPGTHTQNQRKCIVLVGYLTDPPVLLCFLRTLTRQDLVEYISSHYKAPRMVLAAAGGNVQASAFYH